LLAVFDSATGAIEAPNGCSERYTQGLARVTDLTGQPPRDALTALTDEVQTRVAGADAGPLQSAAEGFAPAPTDTMTADEAWYATPAEQRTLVFNEVPEEIKPRLKLVAVVVEVDPALGDGELYLRCELGVGWASNLSATGPASPVSVCRESPMNVYLDGRSIGQIAPEDLSDVDGTRLLISSSPDGPVFSLEQLADGDLEQILGVTSEQLEELRKQYADEA
jgi:hypothetical protein